MTQENYYIGVLKDLKSAIRTAWGSGAEIEKTEICNALNAAIKALEQEPRKGHWINKQHLFSSCSAECSSCHKRSNGYVFDNGFSLERKYYDYCPNCGSDNREVEK